MHVKSFMYRNSHTVQNRKLLLLLWNTFGTEYCSQVVITIICINHLLQFSLDSFFVWIGARICDIFKAIFALPESENDISFRRVCRSFNVFSSVCEHRDASFLSSKKMPLQFPLPVTMSTELRRLFGVQLGEYLGNQLSKYQQFAIVH